MKGVYGEGDTIVLELVNRKHGGQRPAVNENEYCFVFEIEGGKIRAVREYVDTQKVDAIVYR